MKSIIRKLESLIKRYYIPLLILGIPSLLIAIWFRSGNILATGESGIPFYDPGLQFNIIKDSWADFALGYPTNIAVSAKPTYWLFSIMQSLKIPSFVIQALFLWLMMVSAGVAVYHFSKELFPKLSNNYAMLAVFFYWFNPFSLVNVWNRFLNNFIVFYALLPIILFLFIKGINSKKYIYAVFIGLFSFIFSYALSSITFDLMLWLVLFYTALFYFIFNKRGDKLFVIKFFVISVFLWCLVNFWWIYQVLNYVGLGSFSAVTSSSFTTNSNYSTFFQLSQRLGNLIDLLRLKHASFFADTENMNWVIVYRFPLLIFLEFLISAVFLFPLVVRKRQKETLFLGSLLLLAVFFAKGNNPPLGEIFDKVFLRVSFFQLFRNPFEKIGFIISLAAAPLFGFGVSILMEKFHAKWKKIAYLIFFGWLLIVWGGPFWASFVFTSPEIPTNKVNIGFQVAVPNYYQQAKDWLLAQGNNFRMIFFPIGGEGITYTWDKGYTGVELSNQILPITSISFNTNTPFYNEVSQNLEKIFLTRYNFTAVMNLLNSKYLVVRSDIDWKMRGMRDPQTISNKLRDLESDGKFKKVITLGNLQFWENMEWTDKTIYPAGQLLRIAGTPALDDILNIENNKDFAIYSGNYAVKENDLIGSNIVKPSAKFELGSQRLNTVINLGDSYMFPSVRIFPSQYLFNAILLKEKIETGAVKNQNDRILKKLSLLGKRLNEAVLEAERKHIKGVQLSLTLYSQQLNDVLPALSRVSNIYGNYFFHQEDIYEVFIKHFERINNIKKSLPEEYKQDAVQAEENLRKKLIDFEVMPYFGYLEEPNFPVKSRKVYQFSVEKRGTYELLLNTQTWEKYYKIPADKSLQFSIDREVVLRKGVKVDNSLTSFGFFNLQQGKHEISWNTQDEINLVETPIGMTLKVDHDINEVFFPVKNFDPYSEYILNLNYLVKKGSGVEVKLLQNNDRSKKGKIEPRFGKLLGPDSYDFEQKHYSTYLTPSSTADSANLILTVKPWNNCEDIYRTKGKTKCLNEDFRRPYDRTTEVVLDTISLVKVSTEMPILRGEASSSAGAMPGISYKKISADEYQIKIEGATRPFALVFSQLFDPAWKIYQGGKEVGQDHFLANTYANGWIINNKGSYDLLLKFTPRDSLQKGEVVSLVSILICIVLVVYNIRKNYEQK